MTDTTSEAACKATPTEISSETLPQKGPFPDFYQTSDIDTTTVLLTLGHELANIICEKNGKRWKTFFVFIGQEPNSIQRDMIDFTNGLLKVDPKELLNRFREVKNLSHDAMAGRRTNKKHLNRFMRYYDKDGNRARNNGRKPDADGNSG